MNATAAGRERQREAVAVDRRLAAAGGGESLAQDPIGVAVGGGQPAADVGQGVAVGQQRAEGGIDMNDAAVGIDQAYSGAQAIQRVGEGRGLRGFQIDHPAQLHGTAKVWRDRAHAPAGVVVGIVLQADGICRIRIAVQLPDQL